MSVDSAEIKHLKAVSVDTGTGVAAGEKGLCSALAACTAGCAPMAGL